MPDASSIVQPDLGASPLHLTVERLIAASPSVLFNAWTTDQFARWFGAPGTVLMKPEVNMPFFFEARFEDERHPHYGRFLTLETDRRVQMTWVNAAGTRGVETVLTIELVPRGDVTLVRLHHAGFPDEECRAGHEEAWPKALEHLARIVGNA